MILHSTVAVSVGVLAQWLAPWFLDPFVWVYMGFALYGFLAIGHECGHGALFRRQWVNDAVGSVCFLLGFMPYANWMRAHLNHHANASHHDREEYFAVSRRPIYGGATGFFRQLVIWAPPLGLGLLHFAYMLGVRAKVGVFGRDNLYFNPSLNTPLSYVNLAMLALVAAGIVAAGLQYGLWAIVQYALMPMLFTGAVNAIVGYMQHQDHDGRIVRFSDARWSWLDGGLQTVDRTFGIFDVLIHNAARQHCFHHLFPSLPHANGAEAMAVLRPILGEHYRFDEQNALLRFHDVFRNSQMVRGADCVEFLPLPRR